MQNRQILTPLKAAPEKASASALGSRRSPRCCFTFVSSTFHFHFLCLWIRLCIWKHVTFTFFDLLTQAWNCVCMSLSRFWWSTSWLWEGATNGFPDFESLTETNRGEKAVGNIPVNPSPNWKSQKYISTYYPSPCAPLRSQRQAPLLTSVGSKVTWFGMMMIGRR